MKGESIMDNATDETVSLPAAAQALGKSWIQAWRLVLTGDLKGSKVRGRWQIDRESLDRLVEGQPSQ